ncbi:T9SS type A sorting domain-containing protein [Aequorivita sp. H23M31]|uniref:T9SS type A sorting domain-containing protein n=1 Tax=Aequorivita ciconiae TaxID=2494375 RepID=A0A410G3Y2_9FLAO|nr:T9SS type A sorting domain-containing protein [Aequorivita sp. H23M31]QAA81925.1 T9SS type A sorting domain-containing protein [Aequorivita sp. H23M31]
MKKFTFLFFTIMITAFSWQGTAQGVTDYVTINASGFNHDVIAEGAGLGILNRTNIAFDNDKHYLYAEDFSQLIGANPPAGTGLPNNGLLANLLPDGPASYQLQPYGNGILTANNTLQLKNTESKVLTFSTPIALRDLYLLHASGHGPTTINGTITFEDDTTQPISDFTSEDWVSGSNNIAYKKRMRVKREDILIIGIRYTYYTDDTHFYQTKLPINEVNFYKKVKSITLTCTAGTNSNSRFNLMAISGKVAPKYIYQDGAWINNLDPSGVSTANDDILVVNGTTSFTADTEARNITIRTGAILNIPHVLRISGDIHNNGDLIFVSDENGTGEIGSLAPTTIITGKVTVQRHTSNKRAYRIVSSAVTTTNFIRDNWQEGTNNPDHNTNIDPNEGFGTHITGSDPNLGFDVTQTGNKSMYTVDVESQHYVEVPNTNAITLKAGDPYLLMVRGDRSIDLNFNDSQGSTVLRATGSLAIGNQTQNFPQANPAPAEGYGFVMFGNPYQCAVNMKTVLANSNNLKVDEYYVYDPTLATVGAWVTVNLLSGSNNTSGSQANEFLQPGQGAQIAMASLGTSAINFREIDKTPGEYTQTSATGSTHTASDMLTVRMYKTENFNNGGPVHDSFGIIFAEDYNNEVDNNDALKPMNFYENLGVENNGAYLSIERRAMPEEGEIYSMYSTGYSYTAYTLTLKVEGLDSVSLYLEDNFTGTSTLLDQGENSYDFSVDKNIPASIATDRFSIRTEQRLGVDNPSLLDGIRLFPNPINDNVFNITAPKLNGETTVISVNDMLGREVMSSEQTFSGNTLKVELPADLNSGIYMVTISSNGESQSIRVIKR